MPNVHSLSFAIYNIARLTLAVTSTHSQTHTTTGPQRYVHNAIQLSVQNIHNVRFTDWLHLELPLLRGHIQVADPGEVFWNSGVAISNSASSTNEDPACMRPKLWTGPILGDFNCPQAIYELPNLVLGPQHARYATVLGLSSGFFWIHFDRLRKTQRKQMLLGVIDSRFDFLVESTPLSRERETCLIITTTAPYPLDVIAEVQTSKKIFARDVTWSMTSCLHDSFPLKSCIWKEQ